MGIVLVSVRGALKQINYLLTKKPPIVHHASLQPDTNHDIGKNEQVMRWARPPCHNVGELHLRITYYVNINWMKMFPVDKNSSCDGAFIATYYSSDYIRENGSCCKLCFNVGLFNSIVWEFDVPGWHSYDPVPHCWHGLAQMTSDMIICDVFKQGQAAIVNAIFSSLCTCFYIHPYDCKHMGVNCPCVSDVHITLRTNCFHIINSYPASPLSVTKGAVAVETCAHQPWIWLGAPHVSMVISLLIHLNVRVENDVRHIM